MESGVLRLVLNRPQRRNAFSIALYEDLREALRQAAADPQVGAVVLTGAGGAFSAGGDVKRMAGDQAERPSGPERAAALRRRSEIAELLHTMDKPSIAMMRGPAIGAALSIAMACDMRFGDASVRMRTGFLNVGLSGDYGGHYFLPRLVGMAKARELYLTSPMLDAREALELGLLNRIVQAEALEETVMGVARTLANGPRTAIACMKRNLNDGLHASLPAMLDIEASRHVLCTETADHKEAARAWAEKRAPAFSGKAERLAED
jgi:2-(1,2-epoxy-1,2-dihydrophenyl)acetyl-CoA isomerase